MVDIIRAREDDWSLVREIRLRSLSTDPDAFGQSWERESTYDDDAWTTRVQDAAWFLALENEQPVAVVASRHEADSPDNERELQAMWVTPNARKSGIAQKLAEAVCSWANEDGADTVTLYVGPENTSARKTYEALGFADTGDRWEVEADDPRSSWIKMSRSV
ncbi:GNAT family N-acetyltransferase [Brachybacterium endophyticum]|uniref:GNAT family N-acetyltransferase n=1 Tax=Brachybacterium endophyticum TaxID=2182385 RepID=A0A2U2RKH6_9MICO|nr:GNAT family N-acetyltransferase [Brachybacterium endophyticum]PWH06379.1 GNAT family N-acetyltransferase [Brachybacterium endophyticum]